MNEIQDVRYNKKLQIITLLEIQQMLRPMIWNIEHTEEHLNLTIYACLKELIRKD